MYCEHCHHLGDWVITPLRQLNGLPFVFFFAIKQEVLLHHPSEGPGVSIPQRVASRAARRHVEDLPAHVWRANPDARGAAVLLRGLRLVGMHPAAVHGLSLQPGQQQTGREERIAAPAGQKQQYCRTLRVAGSAHGYWRKWCQEGKALINPQPRCLDTLKNCLFQLWYRYWSLQPRSHARWVSLIQACWRKQGWWHRHLSGNRINTASEYSRNKHFQHWQHL